MLQQGLLPLGFDFSVPLRLCVESVRRDMLPPTQREQEDRAGRDERPGRGLARPARAAAQRVFAVDFPLAR